MSYNSVTKAVIFILMPLIAFFLLFILEFENNITGNAKIVSENEWILSKRPDGSLISTLYDRKNNMVRSTSTYQVERGDVFDFNINPSILNKRSITCFDTIGIIQSTETILELAELEKQLAIVKGTLEINLTGTKKSIITQALKELELSRERSNLQNKRFEKQFALFNKNLISEDDLDNEKNIQKIYELQVKIAESNLENLQTGSKPEHIQMIKEEINSVEKEINILKNKIKKFTLFSPLDGKIHKVISEDTIVFIGSIDKIAIVPFDIKYHNEIKSGQEVSIVYNQISETIKGTILDINRIVRFLNNKQTIIATVILDTNSQDIPINLILECKIKTENKTGFEHLVEFSKYIFI